MSPTALKVELASQWQIHNTFHVSSIKPFRIAIDLIRDPPNLDAFVMYAYEMQDDFEGYEYLTGYAVEEIMGSQFNKEQKSLLYSVKWKGYPDETD